MARYYFDVVSQDGPLRDDEGMDLANADDVRAVTAKILVDFLAEEIADLPAMSIKVSVRDDTDFPVFAGRLSYDTEWQD